MLFQNSEDIQAGTNPLERLGEDSGSRIDLSIAKPVVIDGKTIVYRDASIVYHSIYVTSDSGTYDVEIVDGVSVTGILKTDPKVIKNIAIG